MLKSLIYLFFSYTSEKQFLVIAAIFVCQKKCRKDSINFYNGPWVIKGQSLKIQKSLSDSSSPLLFSGSHFECLGTSAAPADVVPDTGLHKARAIKQWSFGMWAGWVHSHWRWLKVKRCRQSVWYGINSRWAFFQGYSATRNKRISSRETPCLFIIKHPEAELCEISKKKRTAEDCRWMASCYVSLGAPCELCALYCECRAPYFFIVITFFIGDTLQFVDTNYEFKQGNKMTSL